MTQKDKEAITSVIKELQEVQVELEKQNAKTPDVNLIPLAEQVCEVTGRLSVLVNPAAADTDGKPGPGPEAVEAVKEEKPGPSVFTAPTKQKPTEHA